MTLVSQAEHARLCGVSRNAVTKWKAQGDLVMVGNLVDHEASYKGDKHHAGAKKARQEPEPAAEAPKKPRARQAAPMPPKTVLPPAPPADAPHVGPAGSTALKEAVTRKEEFAGKLRELEFLERAGKLVDREAAARVQFDQGRMVRDRLLNFVPQRSPFIAAELDIEADKVAQVLTKYLHEFISSLAEPPAKLG